MRSPHEIERDGARVRLDGDAFDAVVLATSSAAAGRPARGALKQHARADRARSRRDSLERHRLARLRGRRRESLTSSTARAFVVGNPFEGFRACTFTFSSKFAHRAPDGCASLRARSSAPRPRSSRTTPPGRSERRECSDRSSRWKASLIAPGCLAGRTRSPSSGPEHRDAVARVEATLAPVGQSISPAPRSTARESTPRFQIRPGSNRGAARLSGPARSGPCQRPARASVWPGPEARTRKWVAGARGPHAQVGGRARPRSRHRPCS